MPSWTELLSEFASKTTSPDDMRQRELRRLHCLTGRNVIAYYSGVLQKGNLQKHGVADLSIVDLDVNGFMVAVRGLDRSLGLDLVLHTLGGQAGATEAIVRYLRCMFGTNIRAIVPQVALSAGTMIALACKEILLGTHSSLGPVDPQILGLPAHGAVQEFQAAKRDILQDVRLAALWAPILGQYPAGFITHCQNAVIRTNELVTEWLETGMFQGDPDATQKTERIVNFLASNQATKLHDRHIGREEIQALGVKVVPFDGDGNDDLQDAVLSIHHAMMLTLSGTATCKIIENHEGERSLVQAIPVQISPGPQAPQPQRSQPPGRDTQES